jgi:hypothetical protein
MMGLSLEVSMVSQNGKNALIKGIARRNLMGNNLEIWV